jgi:hypothetical protein
MARLRTVGLIPSEDVRNRALQAVADLFQGVERYVLLAEF